ncbi:MAG TPA: hypothetical protein VFQ45_04230, partial [Longimicrobium sp.]|nr:hypothetical protein [Longimicrobium sp.]
PMLVLLVPVVDTTLVTVVRTLHDRRVTMGGRDHVTHRLVAMGFSEAGAAVFLYACGAAALGTAWAAAHAGQAEVGMWLGACLLCAALLFAGYLSTLYRYEDAPRGEALRRGAIFRELLLARRGLEIALDAALFALALYGAFIIYYEGSVPGPAAAVAQTVLLPAVALKLLAFHYSRVYRGVWHRAELADVHRVVRGAVLAELLVVAAMFLLSRATHIPRSVFVLDLLLTCSVALAARASFRSLDRVRTRMVPPARTPVLVYGAASESDLLLQALHRLAGDVQVVGFVHEDEAMQGRLVAGLPVLAPGSQLEERVAGAGVGAVVCGSDAVPSAAVLARLEALGVRVLRLEAAFVPLGPEAVADERRAAGAQLRAWLPRAS